MLFFTQLASDNFQRANEDPLNPAVWTPADNVGGPLSNLQIISDRCTGTGSGPFEGSEFYTGVVFPQNQYISLTIGSMEVPSENISEFVMFLRASLPNGLNTWSFGGENGSNATQTSFELTSTINATSTSGPLVAPGDVFLFAVVGAQGFAFRNGVLLQDLTGVTSAPGSYLGITAFSPDSSGTNFTSFRAGAVSLGPTNGTIIKGQFVNQSNLSNPVMGAFAQNANRYQLDLMQIFYQGAVVWKLDHTGTVTTNPTNWTNGTLLGQFYGSSFTTCFQQNNTNPYSLDLIQIQDTGGQIVWWLDYTGTVQFPTSSLPTN